jgi:hypothetical protein
VTAWAWGTSVVPIFCLLRVELKQMTAAVRSQKENENNRNSPSCCLAAPSLSPLSSVTLCGQRRLPPSISGRLSHLGIAYRRLYLLSIVYFIFGAKHKD